MPHPPLSASSSEKEHGSQKVGPSSSSLSIGLASDFRSCFRERFLKRRRKQSLWMLVYVLRVSQKWWNVSCLLLSLALPRTSGLALGTGPRLSVYPPVPGLPPSPYYGLRVREVSLLARATSAWYMAGKSFLQSDNHDHIHQQRQKSLAQILVIVIIMTEEIRILIKWQSPGWWRRVARLIPTVDWMHSRDPVQHNWLLWPPRVVLHLT